MELAMLSHLASPVAPTGAERSLVLLARGLAGRGHTVAVAAPGRWALAPTVAASGIELATIPCRCCWLVAHDRQPLHLQLLRAARFGLPDRGRHRLRQWLAELAPDVVHVNCLPHLGGAAAAADAGLPVVWHVREIMPPGPRRRWFARHLRRRSRRVVAVSEAVACWLREEGLEDRVEVVYNGVEAPPRLPDPGAARDALGLPRRGCLVGFFSQLVAHKGGLEFIRAARLALAAVPELRCVIAGRGTAAQVAQLEREIGAGPGSDRFHLLPAQDEVWPLLAATDVVVLTSLAPDPLPRIVIEAMAAARPVVAFATGGVPEMVADGCTGYSVKAGDCRTLAHRLIDLARDPDTRRRMGQAASQEAQRRFTPAAHVQRMEQILSEVAEQSSVRG